MAYFFDNELPSTSSAVSDFIPGLGHEPTLQTDVLSTGDTNPSASLSQPLEEPRTSVDQINHKAQELLKTINLSRASDQKLMADHQERLSEKLSEKYRQLDDLMVRVYEVNSKMLNEKLAELSEILNNCQRLNQDLKEATQALSHLRELF